MFSTVPQYGPTAQNPPWVFIFDLQPKSITDLSQDVPNLNEKADPDYPSCDKKKMHIATGLPLWAGALNRWDITQSMRITIDNPNKIEQGLLPVVGTLYDGQPNVPALRLDFPASDVEGNDDFDGTPKDDDPYHAYQGDNPLLNHAQGSLSHYDYPIQGLAEFSKAADDQRFDGANFHLEADFATFVRLQIGPKWYRVSGHYNWYFSMRLKYQMGVDEDGSAHRIWQNNSSQTNYTGVTDN